MSLLTPLGRLCLAMFFAIVMLLNLYHAMLGLWLHDPNTWRFAVWAAFDLILAVVNTRDLWPKRSSRSGQGGTHEVSGKQ